MDHKHAHENAKEKSGKKSKKHKILSARQWNDIEQQYMQNDESVAAIARVYGISRHTIDRRARLGKWPRCDAGKRHRKKPIRKDFGAHEGLVTRLVDVFERQINKTEEYLDAFKEDSPSQSVSDRERDARTLASLARTLKQLEDLRRLPDVVAKNQNQDEEHGADGDDMREQLQRRLDQLSEAESQSQIPAKPDDA